MLKRVTVQAWRCKCRRCGKTWTTLAKCPPARCAGCKALHWDKPPRPYTKKA